MKIYLDKTGFFSIGFVKESINFNKDWILNCINIKDPELFINTSKEEMGPGMWTLANYTKDRRVYDVIRDLYPYIVESRYYIPLSLRSHLELILQQSLITEKSDINYQSLLGYLSIEHSIYGGLYWGNENQLKYTYNLQLTDLDKYLIAYNKLHDDDQHQVKNFIVEIELGEVHALLNLCNQKEGIFLNPREFEKFIKYLNKLANTLPSKSKVWKECSNLILKELPNHSEIIIDRKINNLKSDIEKLESNRRAIKLLNNLK